MTAGATTSAALVVISVQAHSSAIIKAVSEVQRGKWFYSSQLMTLSSFDLAHKKIQVQQCFRSVLSSIRNKKLKHSKNLEKACEELRFYFDI